MSDPGPRTPPPIGAPAPRTRFVGFWTCVSIVFLGVVALLAVIGPIIAPEYHPANSLSLGQVAPGAVHPQLSWSGLLGSDVFGRPILQYVLLGSRATAGVAFLAMLIAIVGGQILTSLSGAETGWRREVFDFLSDLALIIPFLPLALVLSGFVAGGDPWALAGIYGIVGIPLAYRLLLPPVAGTAPRLGPKAAGRAPRVARAASILYVVLLSLTATVDFLGFGLPVSDPSWGNALMGVMVYAGFGYWWWLLFPSLMIFLTILAIAILGSALSRTLDSRGVA